MSIYIYTYIYSIYRSMAKMTSGTTRSLLATRFPQTLKPKPYVPFTPNPIS